MVGVRNPTVDLRRARRLSGRRPAAGVVGARTGGRPARFRRRGGRGGSGDDLTVGRWRGSLPPESAVDRLTGPVQPQEPGNTGDGLDHRQGERARPTGWLRPGALLEQGGVEQQGDAERHHHRHQHVTGGNLAGSSGWGDLLGHMASELEVDEGGDALAAQRVDDHQGDGKRQTLDSRGPAGEARL